MVKITVKVDGMMCGMCESHVNDAIRRELKVKKVASSHSKGETVIIAEQDIPDAELKRVIDATGYNFGTVSREPYTQKKGLFGFLHR